MNAWQQNANTLAAFVFERMVNRTDVWGAYTSSRARSSDPKASKSYTAPAKRNRGKVVLTPDVIEGHFARRDIGDVIGLHSTSADNTCRWTAADVDRHGEDGDAQANEAAVIAVYAELQQLGVHALLTDSNGSGGFHLVILWNTPIDSVASYTAGLWLKERLAAHGLPDVETFPKQDRLIPGEKGRPAFGNWLRVPGGHHTRDHWSRVWNGERWLEDADAVAFILAIASNEATLSETLLPVPDLDDADTGTTKARKRTYRTTFTARVEKLGRERDLALLCLQHIPNEGLHYDVWQRVVAAAKHAGCTLEDANAWSRKSTKHVEGYLETKWDSFDRVGGKLSTITTLIRLSRDNGFDPIPAAKQIAVDDARIRVAAGIEQAEAKPDIEVAFDLASDLAVLPPGERESAINDLCAIIGEALSRRELRRAIKDAAKEAKKHARASARPDKPIVYTTSPWIVQVQQSAASIAEANNPPRLFQRSGEIVYIHTDESKRRSIKQAGDVYMRGELGRSVAFLTPTEKWGDVDSAPPMDVARDHAIRLNDTLVSMGKAPLPPLAGIVEAPYLTADGRVITTPGYNAETQLYYEPDPTLELPPIVETPNADDAWGAMELIEEAICDFPFAAETDHANALGLLLSVVVRPLVPLMPMAVAEAPQAGTGKSLLARAGHVLATGRDGTMTSVPESDDEMQKLLSALLLEGASIIIFDNADYPIGHGALAKALTSPVYSARLLGSTKTINASQKAITILTGNNVTLTGDIPRRCFRIRLDAKTSKPWDDGRQFRHPDLIAWVTKNRGAILSALLTVARYWFVSGCPRVKTPKLGSFEPWCDLVGNILAHVGVKGFLENRDEMYREADDDGPQWERFLSAWQQVYPSRFVTVGTIENDVTTNERLREAVPDTLAGFIERYLGAFNETRYRIRDAGKFKIRLGKALKARIGRRYGSEGYHLVRQDDTHQKVATWFVAASSPAGVAGSAGNTGSGSSPHACGNHFSDDVDDYMNAEVGAA